jgi:hypothetical protein
VRSPSTTRRGAVVVFSRTSHDEGFSCNMVVTKPTHQELKPEYFMRCYGCEETELRHRFLKRPWNIAWYEEENIDTAEWTNWNSMDWKQKEIYNFHSQVKLLITNNAFWIVQRATAQSKTGHHRVFFIHSTFPYRLKGGPRPGSATLAIQRTLFYCCLSFLWTAADRAGSVFPWIVSWGRS